VWGGEIGTGKTNFGLGPVGPPKNWGMGAGNKKRVPAKAIRSKKAVGGGPKIAIWGVTKPLDLEERVKKKKAVKGNPKKTKEIWGGTI